MRLLLNKERSVLIRRTGHLLPIKSNEGQSGDWSQAATFLSLPPHPDLYNCPSREALYCISKVGIPERANEYTDKMRP